MNSATSPADLSQLLIALGRPAALVELAFIAGCLLAALALCWLLRGRRPGRQVEADPAGTPTTPGVEFPDPRSRRHGSILFGDHIVDGVLFPLLALTFAYAARHLLPASAPPAVFLLALPILSSLVVIRLTVRVLRFAFPKSALMRVVERSVSWIAWVAVALWITGLLPLMLGELDQIHWMVGTVKISLRSLLEAALNVVVVMVLVLWLSALLEQRLLAGATDNLSLRKIAANALRALLLFAGLMLAMSAAGIDLTALGVFGGALGVGIGLGLQKLASNYISGFVILAERALTIGDMVKVDNFEGRITDINLRSTMIRADNGRESIVPNEMLIIQRVENATRADPKLQLGTVLLVAYGVDLARLREQLVAAVADIPRVLRTPAPEVQLQAFRPEGLELNVLFWIGDPKNGQGNVRSAVNLAILQVLEAAGARFPSPQQVVYQRGAATGEADRPPASSSSPRAT